jgi:hypothetical protein
MYFIINRMRMMRDGGGGKMLSNVSRMKRKGDLAAEDIVGDSIGREG